MNRNIEIMVIHTTAKHDPRNTNDSTKSGKWLKPVNGYGQNGKWDKALNRWIYTTGYDDNNPVTTDDGIGFYTHGSYWNTRGDNPDGTENYPFGEFANTAAGKFYLNINGVTHRFDSREQALQSTKFNIGSGSFYKAMQHQSGKAAATSFNTVLAGNRKQNHPDVKRSTEGDFALYTKGIMFGILMAHFTQSPHHLDRLLNKTYTTEGVYAELFEDAPGDMIWGVGPDGTGHNVLGRMLMTVRKTLDKEQQENGFVYIRESIHPQLIDRDYTARAQLFGTLTNETIADSISPEQLKNLCPPSRKRQSIQRTTECAVRNNYGSYSFKSAVKQQTKKPKHQEVDKKAAPQIPENAEFKEKKGDYKEPIFSAGMDFGTKISKAIEQRFHLKNVSVEKVKGFNTLKLTYNDTENVNFKENKKKFFTFLEDALSLKNASENNNFFIDERAIHQFLYLYLQLPPEFLDAYYESKSGFDGKLSFFDTWLTKEEEEKIQNGEYDTSAMPDSVSMPRETPKVSKGKDKDTATNPEIEKKLYEIRHFLYEIIARECSDNDGAKIIAAHVFCHEDRENKTVRIETQKNGDAHRIINSLKKEISNFKEFKGDEKSSKSNPISIKDLHSSLKKLCKSKGSTLTSHHSTRDHVVPNANAISKEQFNKIDTSYFTYDNHTYYLQSFQSEQDAKQCMLASSLYRMAGQHTPHMILVQDGTKYAVAIEALPMHRADRLKKRNKWDKHKTTFWQTAPAALLLGHNPLGEELDNAGIYYGNNPEAKQAVIIRNTVKALNYTDSFEDSLNNLTSAPEFKNISLDPKSAYMKVLRVRRSDVEQEIEAYLGQGKEAKTLYANFEKRQKDIRGYCNKNTNLLSEEEGKKLNNSHKTLDALEKKLQENQLQNKKFRLVPQWNDDNTIASCIIQCTEQEVLKSLPGQSENNITKNELSGWYETTYIPIEKLKEITGIPQEEKKDGEKGEEEDKKTHTPVAPPPPPFPEVTLYRANTDSLKLAIKFPNKESMEAFKNKFTTEFQTVIEKKPGNEPILFIKQAENNLSKGCFTTNVSDKGEVLAINFGNTKTRDTFTQSLGIKHKEEGIYHFGQGNTCLSFDSTKIPVKKPTDRTKNITLNMPPIVTQNTPSSAKGDGEGKGNEKGGGKDKAKQTPSQIEQTVGTFAQYKGINDAHLGYSTNYRPSLQMIEQLNPTEDYKTSKITTLKTDLTEQGRNTQVTIGGTDEAKTTYGNTQCTISVGKLADLSQTAKFTVGYVPTDDTTSPRMTPELFNYIHKNLSKHINEQEKRTLKEIIEAAGKTPEDVKKEFESSILSGESMPDKTWEATLNTPMLILASHACHTQEVHFFVEQEVQNGQCKNKMRSGNLDEATPNVVLSVPGLNLAYSGSAREAIKTSAQKAHHMTAMWSAVLEGAIAQDCKVLSIPSIGLGAFAGNNPDEAALGYFDSLFRLLKTPRYQNYFTDVFYNPRAAIDHTKQFDKALQSHTEIQNIVHKTDKDVKFLAIELAKQGIKCALVNPSDADVVLGKYDVGEYYKNGHYVGEEDIAATSTAPIGSKGISRNAYTIMPTQCRNIQENVGKGIVKQKNHQGYSPIPSAPPSDLPLPTSNSILFYNAKPTTTSEIAYGANKPRLALKFATKAMRDIFIEAFKQQAGNHQKTLFPAEESYDQHFFTGKDLANFTTTRGNNQHLDETVLYIEPSKGIESDKKHGAYIAKNDELAINFPSETLRTWFLQQTGLKQSPEIAQTHDGQNTAVYFCQQRLPREADGKTCFIQYSPFVAERNKAHKHDAPPPKKTKELTQEGQKYYNFIRNKRGNGKYEEQRKNNNKSDYPATFDEMIEKRRKELEKNPTNNHNCTLETDHDYIQWLFPLPSNGTTNYDHPKVKKEDYEILRKDPFVREQMRKAFELMLEFYGLETSKAPNGTITTIKEKENSNFWKNTTGHNRNRISRILKSMTAMGLHKEAAIFQDFLAEQAKKNVITNKEKGDSINCADSYAKYWSKVHCIPAQNTGNKVIIHNRIITENIEKPAERKYSIAITFPTKEMKQQLEKAYEDSGNKMARVAHALSRHTNITPSNKNFSNPNREDISQPINRDIQARTIYFNTNRVKHESNKGFYIEFLKEEEAKWFEAQLGFELEGKRLFINGLGKDDKNKNAVVEQHCPCVATGEFKVKPNVDKETLLKALKNEDEETVKSILQHRPELVQQGKSEESRKPIYKSDEVKNLNSSAAAQSIKASIHEAVIITTKKLEKDDIIERISETPGCVSDKVVNTILQSELTAEEMYEIFVTLSKQTPKPSFTKEHALQYLEKLGKHFENHQEYLATFTKLFTKEQCPDIDQLSINEVMAKMLYPGNSRVTLTRHLLINGAQFDSKLFSNLVKGSTESSEYTPYLDHYLDIVNDLKDNTSPLQKIEPQVQATIIAPMVAIHTYPCFSDYMKNILNKNKYQQALKAYTYVVLSQDSNLKTTEFQNFSISLQGNNTLTCKNPPSILAPYMNEESITIDNFFTCVANATKQNKEKIDKLCAAIEASNEQEINYYLTTEPDLFTQRGSEHENIPYQIAAREPNLRKDLKEKILHHCLTHAVNHLDNKNNSIPSLKVVEFLFGFNGYEDQTFNENDIKNAIDTVLSTTKSPKDEKEKPRYESEIIHSFFKLLTSTPHITKHVTPEQLETYIARTYFSPPEIGVILSIAAQIIDHRSDAFHDRSMLPILHCVSDTNSFINTYKFLHEEGATIAPITDTYIDAYFSLCEQIINENNFSYHEALKHLDKTEEEPFKDILEYPKNKKHFKERYTRYNTLLLDYTKYKQKLEEKNKNYNPEKELNETVDSIGQNEQLKPYKNLPFEDYQHNFTVQNTKPSVGKEYYNSVKALLSQGSKLFTPNSPISTNTQTNKVTLTTHYPCLDTIFPEGQGSSVSIEEFSNKLKNLATDIHAKLQEHTIEPKPGQPKPDTPKPKNTEPVTQLNINIGNTAKVEQSDKGVILTGLTYQAHPFIYQHLHLEEQYSGVELTFEQYRKLQEACNKKAEELVTKAEDKNKKLDSNDKKFLEENPAFVIAPTNSGETFLDCLMRSSNPNIVDIIDELKEIANKAGAHEVVNKIEEESKKALANKSINFAMPKGITVSDYFGNDLNVKKEDGKIILENLSPQQHRLFYECFNIPENNSTHEVECDEYIDFILDITRGVRDIHNNVTSTNDIAKWDLSLWNDYPELAFLPTDTTHKDSLIDTVLQQPISSEDKLYILDKLQEFVTDKKLDDSLSNTINSKRFNILEEIHPKSVGAYETITDKDDENNFWFSSHIKASYITSDGFIQLDCTPEEMKHDSLLYGYCVLNNEKIYIPPYNIDKIHDRWSTYQNDVKKFTQMLRENTNTEEIERTKQYIADNPYLYPVLYAKDSKGNKPLDYPAIGEDIEFLRGINQKAKEEKLGLTQVEEALNKALDKPSTRIKCNNTLGHPGKGEHDISIV